MAHMVFCVRNKKEMEGLEEPPFDSEFGQKILQERLAGGVGRVGGTAEDAAERVPAAALDPEAQNFWWSRWSSSSLARARHCPQSMFRPRTEADQNAVS